MQQEVVSMLACEMQVMTTLTQPDRQTRAEELRDLVFYTKASP